MRTSFVPCFILEIVPSPKSEALLVILLLSYTYVESFTIFLKLRIDTGCKNLVKFNRLPCTCYYVLQSATEGKEIVILTRSS